MAKQIRISKQDTAAARQLSLLSIAAPMIQVTWLLAISLFFFQKPGRSFEPQVWQHLIYVLGQSWRALNQGLGWNLILLLVIWLVFIRAGKLFMCWVSPLMQTRLEDTLFAAGLGAGIISLLMFALGLAGLWNFLILRYLFWGAVILSIGSTVIDWRRSRGTVRAERDAGYASANAPGFCETIAIFLIILATIMGILAANTPDIFYDSLVYHLALPKLYLLRGGITPTPENLYSGIPFGVEMLYGLALALASETLCSLLHCSFGIFTTLSIWAILRRHASSSAGIFAALLYCSCPLVLQGSIQCGVDIALSFYLTLVAGGLLMVLSTREEAEPFPWLIIMGSLLGFAMSTKYTVFPLAIIFALSYVWLASRKIGMQIAMRDAAVVLLVSITILSPWLIKNLFFYGNPFYPFLNHLIGWTSPADWQGFLADTRARSISHLLGSFAGWKEFLREPWMISMVSRYFDDWIGLSYLLLVPWAIFLPWGISKSNNSIPATWSAIAMLTGAGYLVWSLTSGIVRFLLMIVPLLSWLAALSTDRWPTPVWLKRVAWIAVIISSLFNLQTAFKLNTRAGRWENLLGQSSRTAYLTSERMGYGLPYYAAMEYLNRNLPKDAKVLFLGEPRAYYCERDFISSTVFDNNPFWIAARQAKTANDLALHLKALKVTHIFVNANGFALYRSRATVAPDDIIQGKIFKEFWKYYLEHIYENRQRTESGQTTGWLNIYKLREAADSKVTSINPISTVMESLTVK